MNIKYFVIVNRGEHSGFVDDVDMDKIWRADNQNGWTYQQLTGPHGQVWGTYDTKAEARLELKKYLKCDAAERGDYCYTHNPHGR